MAIELSVRPALGLTWPRLTCPPNPDRPIAGLRTATLSALRMPGYRPRPATRTEYAIIVER